MSGDIFLHLPLVVNPKPHDLKTYPKFSQARSGFSNVFLVGILIDGIAPAIVVPHDEKALGLIQVDRHLDATHDLGNIFLPGNNTVRAGFRDHVHEVDRIRLLDLCQDG